MRARNPAQDHTEGVRLVFLHDRDSGDNEGKVEKKEEGQRKTLSDSKPRKPDLTWVIGTRSVFLFGPSGTALPSTGRHQRRGKKKKKKKKKNREGEAAGGLENGGRCRPSTGKSLIFPPYSCAMLRRGERKEKEKKKGENPDFAKRSEVRTISVA